MTHIAIAEKIETEKTSREIEPEDSSGTLAQLIVSEGGTTIPAVGEARLESKGIGYFEIVVAMIVAAMLVAISALLPLA
jgi:hypothetical protein